jgi:tight adherence protein C
MTMVVALATCLGLGIIGVATGLRRPSPHLDVAWAQWQRPGPPGLSVHGDQEGRGASASGPRGRIDRLGIGVARRLTDGRWAERPRARALRGALTVVGTPTATFCARLVVVAGLCGLVPLASWIVLTLVGVPIPIGPVVVVAVVGPFIGVMLSCAAVLRAARERRRHVRVVLGSFVDLVVLSLAGGVGIDGALHAASEVTPDWAARRMAGALATARDGGLPPWNALGSLGVELGVPELEELATTVQLAGTEGARIRQSLTARGASLRRHEQAEAESAANAMTERLFLPGALLLLGFLVFIGYPAVSRILGGF